MALSVTHPFVSAIADSGDTSIVQPSDWNDAHTLGGFGTGVETALAINIGSAGAPVVFDGALGTPSSGTLTNCTFPTPLVFGTNTIEFRNSTNAQTLNIYNTWTDASNYERGFMRWASNVLEIGQEKAGTGTDRSLKLYGGGGNTFTLGSIVLEFVYGTNDYVSMSNGSKTLNFLGNGTLADSSGGFKITGLNQVTGILIEAGGCTIDAAPSTLELRGSTAKSTATTNIVGGNVYVVGGAGASGSAGAANGGNIYLSGGTAYGTGHAGYILMTNLPTAAAGLPTGAIWSNSGVLTIV